MRINLSKYNHNKFVYPNEKKINFFLHNQMPSREHLKSIFYWLFQNVWLETESMLQLC